SEHSHKSLFGRKVNLKIKRSAQINQVKYNFSSLKNLNYLSSKISEDFPETVNLFFGFISNCFSETISFPVEIPLSDSAKRLKSTVVSFSLLLIMTITLSFLLKRK